MNISELLDLHLTGQLPEDVTLVYVPIRKTAYGDYQIVNEYGQLIHSCAGISEHITLGWLYQRVFVGYGKETKTLIIGKEIVQ